MPHLEACGRTWTVGSDDFVFTGMRGFCINAVFAIGLPIIFRFGDEDCGSNVAQYIITAFAVHCLMALSCLFLMYQSSRGGVFESSRRSLVPCALLLCLVLSVVIAGVAVWGMLLYIQDDACEHSPKDRKWVLAAAICQLVIIGSALCNLCLAWDSLGSMGRPEEGGESFEAYRKLWLNRCSIFFCCIGTEEEAVLNVATVMSGIFAGLDLVSSDIAAGIVLLRAKQIQLIRSAQIRAGLRTADDRMVGHRDVKLTHNARAIPEPTESLNDDVRLLHRYGKYFMAAYGWPLHLFAHPVTGCPTMCAACCCSPLPPKRRMTPEGQVVVVDDDCCKCNTAAWFAETKVPADFLKYILWEAEVECPAYFVCVDDDLKTVILGIRGTLSLADCLTDAQADIIPFGRDICPEGMAHKGIATAALNIKKRIERSGILAKHVAENPGYKLVILGHSLGAGTATLLAVALKSEYESLQCLAYAVPGGLMNLPLSKATVGFVIGAGVGQDLVPRSSLTTVHNVRNRMLEVLSESHKAKCKVMGCCCCSSNEAQANDWFEPTPQSAPRPEERPILDNGDEPTQLLRSYLSTLRAIDPHVPVHEMYPPARFVHIMRVGRRKSRPLYFPIQRDVEELMDEGILASVKMVTDHFPHTMLGCLDEIVDPAKREPFGGWGVGTNYQTPLRSYNQFFETCADDSFMSGNAVQVEEVVTSEHSPLKPEHDHDTEPVG
eukprot:TRINITY_DN20882_c0_g1_i1.p1 TRINITY_DN20882_c0_g1~~TRINITY_DN20882_c0_g1_i1.p1  ORF type:complete len:756 (+),score=272.09 TRINITY_DN20882_c0_g1_i1:109-2268(+)